MLKKIRWLGLTLALLVISTHAQEPIRSYEVNPCPFPALDGVVCGTLTVPEDRDNSASQSIRLAVAVITAANGDPLPDPVIFLEGGPGGSALVTVEALLNHPLRENRNLILFDQRGTGFSQPSLNCPEVEQGRGGFSGDPVVSCYERLTLRGINLNAYTSADSAADVNDLRVALGYEQVNLYGISYGARLALTIMRDYPDIVRSAVLDSVLPPEVNRYERSPTDTLAVLDYLFEQCRLDTICHEAYPTLEDDFYALIADFNAEPPIFEYDDGYRQRTLKIDGNDIAEGLFQGLYVTDAIPLLPYAITQLAHAETNADYSVAYDMVRGWYTSDGMQGIVPPRDSSESVFNSEMVYDYMRRYGDVFDAEGAYLSVECAEEAPFNNADVGRVTIMEATPVLRPWLENAMTINLRVCQQWMVSALGEIETAPVVSDVPSLLISGGFDPITPPTFAESALRGLSNGQWVQFPFGSHGISGVPGCAADLARAFVDAPTETVDDSCVREQTSIDWYVGE